MANLLSVSDASVDQGFSEAREAEEDSFGWEAVDAVDKVFWQAVNNGSTEIVCHMLQNETLRPNINTAGPSWGYSPLVTSIQNGNLPMMQILIDNGADCNLEISGKFFVGKTPLFFATEAHHAHGLEMMKILIDHGASTTVVKACGTTLMHVVPGWYHPKHQGLYKLMMLLDNMPDKDFFRLILQKSYGIHTASTKFRIRGDRIYAVILDMHEERRIEARRIRWINKRRALGNVLMPGSEAPMSVLESELVAYILTLTNHDN